MNKIFNKGKAKINFIIDATLLFVFSAIVGVGFMLKYTLITGEQKIGQTGENYNQTILGFARHEWGDIHLYLGFIFLGLLLLHIVLHWNMIIGMFSKFFQNSILKNAAGTLFIVLCLILIILPFFMNPKIGIIESKKRNKERKISLLTSDSVNVISKMAADTVPNVKTIRKQYESKRQSQKERTLNIRGNMTVRQLCKDYNIPLNIFKEKLGISESISNNMRLKFLRTEYGVKMSEIEKIIIDHSKKNN